MQANRSHQPVVTSLLPVLVFVVPYLFVWQGLDFTDKGLTLAYADGMFRWSEVYGSLSVIWLSGALAHAWLYVVPLPALLSLNILLAVLLNALSLFSFYALRRRFDQSALWGSILLSLLFVIPPLQNGYGYQALSVVLLSGSAFALVNGLVDRKNGWLLVAGALAGVSVFVRLPNVLSIALIFIPVAYALFNNEKINAAAMLRFAFGYAIGLLSVIVLLLVVDQWNVYTSGITGLFSSTNERYAYGTPQGLITTYLRDALRMILYVTIASGVTAIVVFVFSFVFDRIKDSMKQTAWWGLAALVLMAGVAVFMRFPAVFVLKDVQRLLIGGVIILVAFAVLFRSRNNETRLMMLAGLIACVACFTGSDVGFGAYALFPLLLPLLAYGLDRRSSVSVNVPTWMRVASVFWTIVVAIISVGLCAVYVYRDAPRAELSFAVRNEPKLRGIFTSEQRREAVEQLLDATREHVKPNSTIWATPDLPMVYFLTSTKPFTKYPWDNLFNATAFERRVLQSESIELPAAVITASGTTRNSSWPSQITQSNEPDRAQKEKTVTDFLSRHRYVKVWENSFFQLWLPNKN